MAFGQWGLAVLCSQLDDTNQAILLEAVSVLDEALEDKVSFQCFFLLIERLIW